MPHRIRWIPESFMGEWVTVTFHMTDLPCELRESSLLNLIKLGHSSTMLSALRSCADLYVGDVFFKHDRIHNGSVKELFLRVDELITLIIQRIVCDEPIVMLQHVESVFFSPLTLDQSHLTKCSPGYSSFCYDQICISDFEGYPFAFVAG